MKRSFRACIGNLGAFLVFIVLFMLVAVGVMLAAQIVGLVVGIVGGQAVASIVAQLLMMAVLMPVLMGAVYFAWRQLIGGVAQDGAGSGTPPPAASGIEV
jgi:type III secretory pathway component EscS